MHPQIKILIDRYPALKAAGPGIQAAFDLMREAFERECKVLACGNGGSAADADHMAGELLKSFANPRVLGKGWRERLGPELAENLQGGLPVIPLPGLTAAVSAFGNDCDSRFCYAQLVFALGVPGDCLVAISTSGNSKNVVEAAKVARAKEMTVLALTGEDGGALRELADACVRVPESEVYKVQELHLPVYHALCLALECHFFGVVSG